MYKYIGTEFSTIESWIGIPDNPIQRDTEKHAAKAEKEHLKKFDEAHREVTVGVLPNGERYKIDGHTRCFLWARGKSLPLNGDHTLIVRVYSCDTKADVESLYKTFDNKSAAEDTYDRLFSAYKSNGLVITSDLFLNGGITSALRGLDELYNGAYHSRHASLAYLVSQWKFEIELCDAALLNRKKITTQLAMALLITVRKHGARALEFWVNYNEGNGNRSAKAFDGIVVLEETVKEYKSNKNRGKFTDGKSEVTTHSIKALGVTEMAISCYESWRTKRLYAKSSAKRTDAYKYLGIQRGNS